MTELPAPNLVQVIKDVANCLDVPENLDVTMRHITHAAQDTVHGVDYASITVVRVGGNIESLAPTDEVAVRLDQVQSELGEGPTVEAVSAHRDVTAEHLETDSRWPRYGPLALGLDTRAQVALTLQRDGKTLGVLNLYSKRSGALHEAAHEVAELFAVHAAVALGYSRTIETLHEALATRKAIGVAIGLVMGRYEVTQDASFAFLVRVSQNSNVKLRAVCEEIVIAAQDELTTDGKA
ncbi:MAG: hypothetical protein QOI06_2528 [Nocardioidaceae bacterium]|jgi:GAF domain-containing protein|nr:hypothetical protein [Nocardioidaceae bacterium]